jgi:hypothetical protein
MTRSQGTLYWFGLGFCWEGGKEEQHVAAADSFGKRTGHLVALSLSLSLSLLAFILPIK